MEHAARVVSVRVAWGTLKFCFGRHGVVRGGHDAVRGVRRELIIR